jgi:8-oxo-dGTP pyrophosphatase MutT (NUDIX family)
MAGGGNGGDRMSDSPDWMTPRGQPWRQVGEPRPRFENPWMSISEADAVAPTGRPALYGLVHFKNRAAAILPLHDDGTVTMVGQHRFPLRDYSWEIPEGGVPFDEDMLDGAKRELSEETGLKAEHWCEVLRLQLSNSITDEVAVGYLATGLSASRDHAPDETEDLAVARRPFAELLDLAVAGKIQDSLTVAMLLRAHHMAVSGELPRELAKNMLDRRS